MSRRSPGEGSIVQRSDGRWMAAIQVDGKRSYVYGRTRQAVADKLRTLQGQAERNGHLPDPGKLTLHDYLTQWLQQAEPRLRPKTHLDYTTIARLHVGPSLGHVRLSRLQPLHLTRLYAGLLKSGSSKRRVQMVHGFLHKALADAHRWGLLPSNPAESVDAPRRELKEPKLWMPEQVAAFLQAVQNGDCGMYGNFFAFLLASGCREGEALGLRWTDVDWKAGTVRIERQITRVQNRPIESAPKTQAGRRTIALPAWGLEALKRQRGQVAAWRLRAGESWVGGDHVFTTQTGTPPEPTNLRRSLNRLSAELAFPQVRIHDLRHLHLSLLAMHGVPLKVAQQRAGHTSPILTARVYQHVLGDADQQAADALAKVVAQ